MKRKSLLFLFLLSAFLCTFYIFLAFYIGNIAVKDTKTKSDAIIILGARSYIDGQYNPCLESRVHHAADLYKNNYAQKIVMSGGNDAEDHVNEAEIMQKIAIANGVKKEDIILEKSSTSTYENFKFLKPILQKNNLSSVIIVTEPFHIARASLIAEKQQYNFTLSPVEQSPCWQTNHYLTKYFLKEPLAIILYKLQNKL